MNAMNMAMSAATGSDQIDQQDESEQDALNVRLAAMAKSMLNKRNEAIEHRSASGIERQWREDQRAFEGLDNTTNRHDMVDYATGDAWIERKDIKTRRSKVIVNIVRGKCDTSEGRFSEIILPTDDQNWGISPTPIPTNNLANGSHAAIQPGQQPGSAAAMMLGQQPNQSAPSSKLAEAKRKAALMQDAIADQLMECDYNAECRKVQRQAIRLGTGVLKGPNVVKTVKKSWKEQTDGKETVYVMQMIEELSPASKWIDCWNVYPDPHCGSDVKRGAYVWERDHLLPRELRALIDVPGYNAREIVNVLNEEPIRTVVILDKGNNQRAETTLINRGAPYERWEYHGDVDREDLEAMGCQCPDDISFTFSACVVFVNDRPIKVQLNTLDSGELPYDFFQWCQLDHDTPWGMGEARKMIWQQRIITAAWRAMMDNAGDSSGAQIVISKDTVPEDGVWEVTGKKIWVDERDEGDVRTAFSQYQIANNQPELERIIALALRFTDLESGTPALAQGEKGSAPETLGGMQLLMQSADTTRRRQVKQWDDQVTKPHIGRYYDWNMQYNKNSDIKGDFNVDARGTSVLLMKDQAAQSLLQLFQMKGDPDINLQVDWTKVVKQFFDIHHMADVLKSDEEVQSARQQMQQAPQVLPQVQVAQIRAEAEIKKGQFEAEVAKHMSDVEIQEKDKDRQLELVLAQVKQRIEEIKDQGSKEIAFENLKAMLASTSLKLNVQKDLSLAGHISDLHKYHNPQVVSPAVEPVGRAAPGNAFQE